MRVNDQSLIANTQIQLSINIIPNQMDNARVPKQPSIKKITQVQKTAKHFKTIDYLERETNKKKYTIHQYQRKKESHPLLAQSNAHKYMERKIKSFTKHQPNNLFEISKKRNHLRTDSDFSTLEGLLKKNLTHAKYSLSRERDRQSTSLTKQKYKRSQNLKTITDYKKMSYYTKSSKRDNDHISKLGSVYTSKDNKTQITKEEQKRQKYEEIQLENIINENGNNTLQDVFQEGCEIFYQYLQMNTILSILTQKLQSQKQILQKSLNSFKLVQHTIGDASIKNLLMLGLIYIELQKYDEGIMYLSKVLDRNDGNLFLIDIPSFNKNANEHNTLLSTNKYSSNGKYYKLNLKAYYSLAMAYKETKNYLCGVNVISKFEIFYKNYLGGTHKKNNQNENQYYTLPQRVQDDKKQIDFKIQRRNKKKSHLLTILNIDQANHFKKYNSSHNYSSIELSQMNTKIERSERLTTINQHKRNDEIRISENKDNSALIETLPQLQNDNQTLELLAQLFLLKARLYIKIKSYDLATENYKKCLQYNLQKIEPILQLASIFYVSKNIAKSIGLLDDILQKLSSIPHKNEKNLRDIGYIQYHKCLIHINEQQNDLSFQILNQISIKQLNSEVFYYKGTLLLKQFHNKKLSCSEDQKNILIEQILMEYQKSISSFTSLEYVVKAYYYKIIILLYEKKDYYGAQYEIDRLNKIIGGKKNQNQQQKDQKLIMLSRISRVYEETDHVRSTELKEEKIIKPSLQAITSSFQILFKLIDAIICMLKMKITKGIQILKQLSLQIQNEGEYFKEKLGYYFTEIVKTIYQFKFYGYYITREYELSLKYVNKLVQILEKQAQNMNETSLSPKKIELKLISINRLMLECMILMKQQKFNYALSKLAEIENMTQSQNDLSLQFSPQTITSTFISNNLNMVKSLCYINLYTQLQRQKNKKGVIHKMKEPDSKDDPNNQEILLSAEQLLRHCLISDKQNSLIYYLISVIHYELNEYESSLKYIRQALEYSDDHMIKHYFCKANIKFMLKKYDEAIKDYTNAIIVCKEQSKGKKSPKKNKEGQQKYDNQTVQSDEDEYHQEKQIMLDQIYLNRAIAYLKYAYQLSMNQNYVQQANIITSYKIKAAEDLSKYFTNIFSLKSKTNIDKDQLRNRLLLFMHTDDPNQLIEIYKQEEAKQKIINDEDYIKLFYLIKQLNNCIVNMKKYINIMENVKQQSKNKQICVLPPKNNKKISISFHKNKSETSIDCLKISKFKFDLCCLQALKKSSNKNHESIEQSLISLLQLTQQVYKKKQVELDKSNNKFDFTLEELFSEVCGEIFGWSDILFFIGVMHYELEQYQTALKYFEQSLVQKKGSGKLYSLQKYMKKITKSREDEDECMYYELENLFQNRIYCKQEIQYNIGLCYLMMSKYKQACDYLDSYHDFLVLIKKQISSSNPDQNQFMNHSSHSKDIIIDPNENSNLQDQKPGIMLISPASSRSNRAKQVQENISSTDSKQLESDDQYHNITPFPTHNRLCSIYNPKIIGDKKFYLSFCLPKINLPLLNLFSQNQVELATIYRKKQQKKEGSESSLEEIYLEQESEDLKLKFSIDKSKFPSIINNISLLDVEMKPIAPWIKQTSSGVIFTECLINQSIEINTQRIQKKQKQKNKASKNQQKIDGIDESKFHKKNKKQRYAEYQAKQ